MYCLFGHFVGNTILLGVAEITINDVSFHSDTNNTFSRHCYRATAGLNVKIAIQKVGKDPEQNLVGCFDELKINNGILQF